MKKIYVGCALSDASGLFVSMIADLKKELAKQHSVLEFLGTQKGTVEEVFEHDRRCVEGCDLFLAICDHTSIGLGIEIGLAIQMQKPVLAVAHVDTKVSRMLQGIQSPYFEFTRYQDFADVPAMVERAFEE